MEEVTISKTTIESQSISMKNYLRIGLLIIAIIFTSIVFYYSGLETKSYNRDETYYDADSTGKAYVQRTRPVLITENANNNGSIVAFGIIAAASLIGIAILSTKDPE